MFSPVSAVKPKYKSLPGVRRFARFLRQNKVSYAVAAAALRVSGHTIWAWRHGHKLPTEQNQKRIEIWTHGAVPREGWMLKEERQLTEEIQPWEDPEADPEPERRNGTTA